MFLYLIVILWGAEQVVLQRVAKSTLSDYALRCLGIALVVGVVSVIISASPPAIGAVVAGVLGVHGLVTTPLLFIGRERRVLRRDRLVSSPQARKQTPFL